MVSSDSFLPYVYSLVVKEKTEFGYDISLLREVNAILSEWYIDFGETESWELEDWVITGFVNAFGDIHTSYFPPVDAEVFRESIRGDFEWIGAFVDSSPEGILIDRLIKWAPAQEAWLLQNDIVIRADETLLKWMTINEAITYIKWPKWTPVTLEVLRAASLQPIKIVVVRDKVEIPSISHELLDEGFVHIELSSFSATSYTDLVKIFQKNGVKDTKGIILDLRFNGWWLLDVAINIVGAFVEAGSKAVTIKGYTWFGVEWEEVYKTKNQPILAWIPLVILMNGSSASASEVVAGALQDYAAAVVIWEQSYGKWSVQQARTLSNGGEIKYTTSFWFTPGEQRIEWNGVTPDKEIFLTLEDYENDEDPQLEEAIRVLQELENINIEEYKKALLSESDENTDTQ